MASYICDGCKEQIPPRKARIHCQTCPDYDSCANCYVLGVVAGNHTAQHSIALVYYSGVSDPPTQSNSASGPGLRGFSDQPTQQPNNYGPSQNPFTVWTPLFNADSTPGPDFITMMQQFFGCLDPSRTGSLTPEAYSGFMEVQGFPTPQIVWKNAYRTAFGNEESQADLALKSAYERHSIEHILKMRNVPNPTPQRVLADAFSNLQRTDAVPYTIYRNPMPLLTLRGFIDSTAMEVLANQSQGWTYLNRALHYYMIPIWREKGDIPREMIPMGTPPGIELEAIGVKSS